ncbi:NADH-quinone oxidoreductase subunit N [bacterium]|nr:MAG: NADH-quinone oxidoreductase subunit N [bacterium]
MIPDAFKFPLPETNWHLILPIVMVILTGIGALILELLQPKKNNNNIAMLSVFGLAVSAVFLALQLGAPSLESFAGTLLRDRLSVGIQLILVVGSGLIVLFSEPYLRERKIPFAEFYPLILWSTSGAMLMASTKNLLVIFVGLEILSISLYVLAGLSRDEESSNESALKYFLLGAFASGFLLYGIAMVYGASGTLSMDGIALGWAKSDPTMKTLVAFGLAMILVGLGFKASFFPFQQWTPDVYQGAPTNVTAYMATGSKVAAFTVLYRVLESSVDMKHLWLPALGLVAILTIVYGNLVALLQKDVKRILGFSSIAQAGYVLVAILAHGVMPTQIGPDTLLYFLLGYTLTTIGAFSIIGLGARDGKEYSTIEDIGGLVKRSPLAAWALVIFMASLLGLPPTAGLLGKLRIFQDAVNAGLTPLAIVVALGSIASGFYYLRIAYLAVAPDRESVGGRFSTMRPAVAAACGICLVGVVGAFFFFGPVLSAFGANP